MIIFPCIAARNLLRLNLTNFYGDNEEHRNASCKIMPDERPAPNAGREFISIYCSAWNTLDGDAYSLHEDFEITCAVTHRYGDVPFDRLGEAAYLKDEDVFVQQYYTIEQRVREIVKVIHPDYEGWAAQITAINALLNTVQAPYDKLWFAGADSQPKIVGPEHFHAVSESEHPSGLLWKVRFRGSGTLHTINTLDEIAET